MAVDLATVTGAFPAGVAAYPEFTPSQGVVLAGGPELLGQAPVKAQIVDGALKAADGTSALQLAMTNQGTPVGPTGFWFWTVTGLPGIPEFSFFLTADSDITALLSSGAAAGAVSSVNGHTGVVDLAAADVGAVAKAGDTMAGHLAPKVVALADAASIAVDASLGNDFRVTLAGNRTLAAPANPVDGQQITVTVTQDATGGRTLAFDPVYKFGAAGAPTVTATAGDTDVLGFRYYATPGAWRCMGVAAGF